MFFRSTFALFKLTLHLLHCKYISYCFLVKSMYIKYSYHMDYTTSSQHLCSVYRPKLISEYIIMYKWFSYHIMFICILKSGAFKVGGMLHRKWLMLFLFLPLFNQCRETAQRTTPQQSGRNFVVNRSQRLTTRRLKHIVLYKYTFTPVRFQPMFDQAYVWLSLRVYSR